MKDLTDQFDWNQARAFLATAELGSLTKAAEHLGQTQPTLSRQIAAFEDSLGIALFERIGKRLFLTPTGQELLPHVKAMQEAATALSLGATGQSQTIEGKVTISATDIFSAYHLPQFILEFQKHAPKITIEILAENTITNLQRREADIAIRHVRPTEPELIAKLVGQAEGRLYAARSYLDQIKPPKKPSDLNDARFLSYGDENEVIAFLKPYGFDLGPQNFLHGSKDGLVGWQMVRAGLGIGMMSRAIGEQFPEVEHVLPDHVNIEFPVWLTAHRDLISSVRIRMVFDALEAFIQKGRKGVLFL